MKTEMKSGGENCFTARMRTLRARLRDANVEVALITDDDSVYYYTGYYDYLHMDFGRPTILIVTDDASALITPSMESQMARAAAQVDAFAYWNDGDGDEWRAALRAHLATARATVALEVDTMPPVVRAAVNAQVDAARVVDATPIIAQMRMIKSPAELQLARHAGEVANAMMAAARAAIAPRAAEFEVALAAAQAGTHAAAALLEAHYDDARMSPMTHFLQIMASGEDIVMPHHRASTRRMQCGDPVFVCLCGMTNFHRFKLGFDRTFWLGAPRDSSQARMYQVALDAQAAALEMLRPGTRAQAVHAAYAQVIRAAGYDYPFRCGRATGFSFLEHPQLVAGDETPLESGMVFAVDGSVSGGNFRAQVGDSFIITDDGYEPLTSHPKRFDEVIIA